MILPIIKPVWLQHGLSLLACVSIACLPAPARSAAVPARPVLVELFTSQGCSSCPPADAVLRELAGRGDVLALGFHVDYWDKLGWADLFASPQFTARQQRYARREGWQIYTPQLVIDGAASLVGSRQAAAVAGIAEARGRQRAVRAEIVRVGQAIEVRLGATAETEASGEIWLISFDAEQVTSIPNGENAGRRIVYPNVVRSLRKLGDWSNQPLELNESLKADERGERLALLVQDRLGQVWALASTTASR